MGCSTCRHQDKPDDYPACVACRNGSGWRSKEADTLDEMEAQLAEKDKKIAELETRNKTLKDDSDHMEAAWGRESYVKNTHISMLEAKLAAMRDVLEWAADYVRRWHIRYPDDGETQRLKEKCDKALAADAGKGEEVQDEAAG